MMRRHFVINHARADIGFNVEDDDMAFVEPLPMPVMFPSESAARPSPAFTANGEVAPLPMPKMEFTSDADRRGRPPARSANARTPARGDDGMPPPLPLPKMTFDRRR